MAAYRAGLSQAREPVVFCLGMQRSGTTSFGDFCSQHVGLTRRGFDYSIANEWTRAWMEGDFERIFASPDFRTGEIFEDDPWWCPGFYETLSVRFPAAKFVLITRDPDRWFRSLLAHSNGRSPGHTDLHAAIYGREAELEALRRSGRPWRKVNWQGLSLVGCDAHYKARYRAHTEACRTFFADKPGRFLEIELEDPEKFRKVAVFLGREDRAYPDVRVNVIASR